MDDDGRYLALVDLLARACEEVANDIYRARPATKRPSAKPALLFGINRPHVKLSGRNVWVDETKKARDGVIAWLTEAGYHDITVDEEMDTF